MDRRVDSNPHFNSRRNNDPTIEFPAPTPPPARRSRPRPVEQYPQPHIIPQPRRHHDSHPADHHSTPSDPRHQSRPPPQTRPHPESRPPHFSSQPDQQHQEPLTPHFAHQPDHQPHHEPLTQHLGPHSPGRGGGHGQHSPMHSSGRRGGRHHHHHHRRSELQMPESKKTRPLAWLVAAFCALFWILVIIGGLVILIVYLVFRPRNPRFDISTATLNAAYLDMGQLLNADVTVLANFTNPNTKVNVDFTYIVLDLYYEKRFVATRYIAPFSVPRLESRFADVHMVASQVALPAGHSLELQRQIAGGRVKFEIRGLFKTRSRFGGVFQYTYWLYAHCQLVVAGPPTGVLIGKRCVTKQ